MSHAAPLPYMRACALLSIALLGAGVETVLTLNHIGGIESISSAFVALAALAACVWYRQDVHNKRTEWLYKLFVDFYDKETYSKTRRILEYRDNPEIQQLALAIDSTVTPPELELMADDFCDYLNFFEFMCNLVDTRRMSRKDLWRLFDYYLDNLASHRFACNYIFDDRHGFEALGRHLRNHHRDKIPEGIA